MSLHLASRLSAVVLACALLSGCGAGSERPTGPETSPAPPFPSQTEEADDASGKPGDKDHEGGKKNDKGDKDRQQGDKGDKDRQQGDNGKGGNGAPDLMPPPTTDDMNVPADLCATIAPAIPRQWGLTQTSPATYGSEAGDRMATCTLNTPADANQTTTLFVAWRTAATRSDAEVAFSHDCEAVKNAVGRGTFAPARCLGTSRDVANKRWAMHARVNPTEPGVITVRLDTTANRLAKKRSETVRELVVDLYSNPKLLGTNQ